MTGMKVNTDTLNSVGKKLQTVKSGFADADSLTKEWSAAVGHARLASALTDFADNWDDTRQKMIDSIDGLGEAAEGIAGAIEECEKQLADSCQAK